MDFYEMIGVDESLVNDYINYVKDGEYPSSGYPIKECREHFEKAAAMREKAEKLFSELYNMDTVAFTDTMRKLGVFAEDDYVVDYTPEALSEAVNGAYAKGMYVSVELPKKSSYGLVLHVFYDKGMLNASCYVIGVERCSDEYDMHFRLGELCAQKHETLEAIIH